MANPKAPAGLEARGRRMWRDSLSQWSLSPAHLVLLEEACRAADRLELLDSIIRAGAAGVNDPESESGDISGWLAEARLQAGALKMLLAEIRQGAVASATPAKSEEAQGVSDLTAKIAARRKKASS